MASVFLKEYCQSFPEGTSQEGCLKEYRQKYSCAVSFSWKPRPADSEGWRTFPAAALNNSIIQLLCFFQCEIMKSDVSEDAKISENMTFQKQWKYYKSKWKYRNPCATRRCKFAEQSLPSIFFSPCLTCSPFCLQFDHCENIWSLWQYLITVKISNHCENVWSLWKYYKSDVTENENIGSDKPTDGAGQ